MRKMSKSTTLAVFVILLLISFASVKSVFADVPIVENVIAFSEGEDTELNVTVYHFEEVPGDYVNLLTVTLTYGTPNLSQSFPQSGPHTLDPLTHTFNVTLNIGPINDSPLAVVKAHCIQHDWSQQNWTGPVPEYSFPLVLMLSMSALTVLLKFKKLRRQKKRG